jgi:tetratricopeptide (TPR) repeat protein
MQIWKKVGFFATVIIVLAFPAYLIRKAIERSTTNETGPTFVGRTTCIECHKKENDLWMGSHHDLAMDTATVETVLGNFNNFEFQHKGKTHRFYRKDGKFFVNTNGPEGKFGDFQIAYTFGYTPLQQYLVPFEGGRLQCLPIAWDTEKKKWFHLGAAIYPDQDLRSNDWLYWTNQAQNWNGMCADCHSTNLQKNYDPASDTFKTTWSEIDVSCEACHGPASEHLNWANLPEGSRPENTNSGLLVKTSNLDNTGLINICARCHSRRAILSDYPNNNDDLLNYMTPQLITQPIYHADGQILDEDYEYASFTQSKMFEKGIKCNDCHDSHSVKALKDDNELCLKCHRPDIYNNPSHHFHQMPPVNGKHLVNRGEPEYKQGTGSQCVNCHMVGRYYMGNDYRRDHSFRIPRPDLTLSIQTPNACNDCHKDKTASWSQGFIEKWYGTKKRPHYGETFAAAQNGDPSSIPNLILYAENEVFPLMVRATAVSFLANFNDTRCKNAIEKALSDPASLIRHSAINSYQPEDVKSFEKTMLPLLNDPVKSIRMEAGIMLSAVPETQLSEPARQARKAALDEYLQANLYISDFAGGSFNLGIMYSNLGQIDKAVEAYKKSLTIDDLFYMAKVNLALIVARQGKNDEAERLLREVVAENPPIPDVYYSLALLLAEKGNIAEARSSFEKAAELMPANARVLYNLGLFENSQRNKNQAEMALLKALKIEPDNYDFLYALSTFYLEHKENVKAAIYARQLTEKYPGNSIGQQLLQASGQ